jgi:hypothetical protein
MSKETYKKLIAVKGERTWREMLEIAARELEKNERLFKDT